MDGLEIASTTGEQMAVDEVARQLERRFHGELIRPGDAGYDSARRVWNGLIDRRPALIARCRGCQDVVTAVNLARDRQLLVSVRGGGHQVAGTAVCDGGLVIDLSQMKRVQVDPRSRTARAEGGVVWGELDRATQVFGLATTGGEVSTTGIAGLTLGGGLGMLHRRHGLACDNLLSVEIVTADGELRTASEQENPDLFWALRGSGRGFGAVTSLHYRLHPLGPEVMVATVFYPMDQAPQVLAAWRDFAAQAPDTVTSQLIFWTVPASPLMPSEVHGKQVVIALGLHAGPAEEGLAPLEPLRRLGPVAIDASGPAPYVEMQSALDSFAPAGDRYYWKSLFLDRLEDPALQDLVAFAGARPSPRTLVVLRHLGGAISRVPEDATAYANRSAQFNLSFDSIWTDPNEDARNITWTRDTWNHMSRHSSGGVYVNFAGFGEEGDSMLRAAHGTNYAKLLALKQKYDPQNLFRLLQ